MKKCSRLLARGFTLVELIVVVAIMAILLSLAGTMMGNATKGQGLQDSVQALHDLAKEARLEAVSRSTWARLVVVSDPTDATPESKNLRYLAVMYREPVRTGNAQGKWMIASERYLPAGFYVSPKFSTLVKTQTTSYDNASVANSSTFAQLIDKMRMGNAQEPPKDVFFIEFDAQGRMAEPSAPTRLVVMSGTIDPNSMGDDAGIRPSPARDGRPTMAGGIVIWPKGNISELKNPEQIFGDKF